MITANGILDAVREVELHAASEQADGIRRTAEGGAEQILLQAKAEASGVIARRCAAAERLAQLDERERLAEARAGARGTVLRAQRAVLIDARAAGHRAVRDLVGDPRLERLLHRLAADARKRLAMAGPVQIVATSDGGFVARAGTHEIDYSLRAQVDRIVDAMAGELERLWR
ncbi:MAG TPA: V-type ATP synthase subunit E family protein [Solirubrobacteraceae bacterium]|nr:V-type ATP synthase subunit E family protein [Solirubrobacteraceae bacterium]